METDWAGEGSVDSPTTSSTDATDYSSLSSGEFDALYDDEALIDYLLREGLTPADVPVCRSTLPCIVAYLKNSRSPDTSVTDVKSLSTSSVSAVEETAVLGTASDHSRELSSRNSLLTRCQSDRRIQTGSQRPIEENQPRHFRLHRQSSSTSVFSP